MLNLKKLGSCIMETLKLRETGFREGFDNDFKMSLVAKDLDYLQ